MEEELIGIKNSAISLILESPDLKNLEEVKLQFLGRSGKLTLAIKGIAKLPEDRRPEIGALANEVKQTLENAICQLGCSISPSAIEDNPMYHILQCFINSKGSSWIKIFQSWI